MLIISPKTRLSRHDLTRRGLLTGAAVLSMSERGSACGTTVLGITPRRASAFGDTIGVNAHMGSGDSFYTGAPAQIVADCVYYGATKVRDNFSTDAVVALPAWTALAAAGIQIGIVCPGGTLNPVSNIVAGLNTIASAIGGVKWIRWFEGPNEFDNFPGQTYNGLSTWQGMANFMKDVYA